MQHICVQFKFITPNLTFTVTIIALFYYLLLNDSTYTIMISISLGDFRKFQLKY